MNKKMRELLAKIEEKRVQAKAFMDGENKDVEKAEGLLNEIDELQKEYEVAKRLFEAEKHDNAPTPAQVEEGTKKADGFVAVAKMVNKQALTDDEKALIVNGTDGENNLLPQDIKLAINELRRQYKSAKSIVTVETTSALTGSVNYEDSAPAGLTELTDGADIAVETNPKFKAIKFTIRQFAKLIPVSRLLAGAEKAGLMGYINRWFLKNAILTENAQIFATLKKGKTAKAIKGWEALKKSINNDLDPDALFGAVIVTNQTGFGILDEEKDANGRPILQPNPANPTQKLFQGLPVEVFADRLLPLVDDKAPIIYGNTKAGCTFVEYSALEFATSEHFYFGKNQNCIRVIEGFDVMATDNADVTYIYGTFEPTPEPVTPTEPDTPESQALKVKAAK